MRRKLILALIKMLQQRLQNARGYGTNKKLMENDREQEIVGKEGGGVYKGRQ